MRKIIFSLIIFFGILFGNISGVFAEENCEYKEVSKGYDDINNLIISKNWKVWFVWFEWHEDSKSFIVIDSKEIKDDLRLSMYWLFLDESGDFVLKYYDKNGNKIYKNQKWQIVNDSLIFKHIIFKEGKKFNIGWTEYSSTNEIKDLTGTWITYEIVNSKFVKPYRAIYKEWKIISWDFNIAYDFHYYNNWNDYVYVWVNDWWTTYLLKNNIKLKSFNFGTPYEPIISNEWELFFIAFSYSSWKKHIFKEECKQKKENINKTNLISSKLNLLRTKNWKKYINMFEEFIPKLKTEKLKKVLWKLEKLNLDNPKIKKHKILLEYIKFKILVELENRE